MRTRRALTVPGAADAPELAPDGWQIPPYETGKRDVPLLSLHDATVDCEMGPKRDRASSTDREEALSSQLHALGDDDAMLRRLDATRRAALRWLARDGGER